MNNELLTIIDSLKNENKQLKEQLENDIDRYEDTISYQLGFDKGKEYLQQRIDKATKILKGSAMFYCEEDRQWLEELFKRILEILGDKENE